MARIIDIRNGHELSGADGVRTNSLKAWFLAARPKTLSGAAVPVMIGAAHAVRTAGIEVLFSSPAVLLCFLFAFIMQIDANFVNDYYDCQKGRDNEERLGPLRACQQGWVTMRSMRIAIAITTLLACIAGLPLAYYGGIEMIAVGAACVIFCFLYTTCLSSIAMGDVLVLLFFGLVPVCCTYYVAVSGMHVQFSIFNFQWSSLPWVSALSCGMVVDTLLIVNNYRDTDNDAASGKKTLVVYLGRKKAEWLYLFLPTAALVMTLLQFGWSNENLIFCFIVYFLYIQTWNKMRSIGRGKALNKVLGMTARNIFIYGFLISALIILA